MALNKFMHPRNIYKTPPDFEKLMKTFSEFSSIAKMDAKGKVTIDFKDPRSIRILTKYLLKSDFNLDVEIPEDRLVPTLPLRLNYILWVEDLLSTINRETNVRGIDIGTGACAIYPLLAAVKNKWCMVGTEMDAMSLQQAQKNVQMNKLEKFIEIKSIEGPVLIENIFTEDTQIYDFCMCNPPFYSNIQELCESRSPARLPPKNGFTGSVHELITEGGELEFCRKLIKESKNCKNNVLLFTTMIGHKYNLSELLQDLKAEKINHTHTEFCQGRVTRWGLAWTFQKHDIYKLGKMKLDEKDLAKPILLYNFFFRDCGERIINIPQRRYFFHANVYKALNLVPPREKPRKKIVPIVHKLPELKNCVNNVENAYNKLKEVLLNINVQYKVLNKQVNLVALEIVTNVNTWSNQRRKKRQLKRNEEIEVKKIKLDSESNVNKSSITSEIKPLKNSTEKTDYVQPDRSHDSLQENYQSSEETEPLVHAFLKIFKKENYVHLETVFLAGTGGKESLHQIIQYIKNNWK